MRIRAPVLVLSVVTSMVLALTTAAPAAWARVAENGGPVTGIVTTNSNGGTTTTVTTSNGSSSTVTSTSTSSNGTTTTTTTQTTTSTTNGTTATTSNSTSTSSNGTTAQSTTTVNDSTGNSTTTTVTDSNNNQTTTTTTTTNGTTTSSTVVNSVANGTATVQNGSMVILSTSQQAQTQDTGLVTNATVITLPSPTQGESVAAYQQALEQWLQAHPDAAQAIQNAQLAVTTGGTGWVNSVMNQAIADITNNTVLQVGGSNAVTGAQMLVQAANLFASSGLSGLESNLNALASMSGGAGSATDPWAGNGYASNANGGTTGASLYSPSTIGSVQSTGGGGGGGGSCPSGELGTPPNCYIPIHNPPPPPSKPSSQWYAIAVPAWMNSWLNVGQQSLGNGDQTASAAKNGGQDVDNQNSANYVPNAPDGAQTLAGGVAAVLTNESAQVYGSYEVTTTQTETEYKTVTVPEQETGMVAETQTVPGYWEQVPVTQPGYYSTETVNHPGYYTSQSVDHPGYTTTEYHPGSCTSVYHPGHTGVTYVNGRPHVAYYPGWTSTSCSSGYTTTVDHPGYTTTEQVWHPGYTTSEQVWNPPVTVMQAEWVPPTTETVEVPETYTAYVQVQQAYTVQVPVTQTLTGWHTVTSQVAQPTVLTAGNSGGQQGTAAAELYVAPVSAQSDPWLE